MKENELKEIVNFIDSFHAHINEYEYQGSVINNKVISNDASKDGSKNIISMADHYDTYKENFIKNTYFYTRCQYNLSLSGISFEYRFKNAKSLIAKVFRNLDKKLVYRKLCNDIIGTRVIIDSDLSILEIKNEFENIYEGIPQIRVIDSTKDVGYKAVHIYVSHKKLLPVEIQIWREKDRHNNHTYHAIYKQSHFKKDNNE